MYRNSKTLLDNQTSHFECCLKPNLYIDAAEKACISTGHILVFLFVTNMAYLFSFQGNMNFVECNDEASIQDKAGLNTLAHLLEVDEEAAEKALLSRVVATHMEVMEKGHTVEQALYGRDAFAKVCTE